jgi:dihydropteroate synthase
MGILNMTSDSFFDGGRYLTISSQVQRAGQMLAEGAGIIDIGAVSTRPGASEVSCEEELDRLIPSLKAIRKDFPAAILSVDTFRPAVARAAVEEGADMINDIYGGRFEAGMMETVAYLKVPYIIMHMKGRPGNMQENPTYSDIIAEITYFFEKQLAEARNHGIRDIIIDPGFGFGKSIEHNYRLLSGLESLQSLEVPILAGLSRKTMIHRVLGTDPAHALNGTSVLQTIALMKGAGILRSHDVKEAVEAVTLLEILKKNSQEQ